MTKNRTYKQRVTFFIDILGFKEMIDGENAKSPQEIINIFNKVKDYLNPGTFQGKKISTKNVIQFSDSIIISFDFNDPSQLFYTIVNILYLQLNLAVGHNVLIRGACQLGNLIHNKDLVFGHALNKAYELEAKCAIYPRIIIPEEIINICSEFSTRMEYNPEYEKEFILKFVKKDTDGYFYIDYIDDTAMNNVDSEEEWASYMSRLKELIENGLKINSVSVKQKYLWLKDKYNKAVNKTIIQYFDKTYGISLEKIK